jgi:Protein of unknown function with PCYCGC motif
MKLHQRKIGLSAIALVSCSALIPAALHIKGESSQVLRAQCSSPQRPNTVRRLHYHNYPPDHAVPSVIDKSRFSDDRSAYVAYSLAAQIPAVLYQEPCYCACDQSDGHESLLDCFTSRHGVFCPACKKEAIFCFEQTRRGRTPDEIRKALAEGSWSRMNLEESINKYDRR